MSAGGRDVVVLDEDAVVQARAMIRAPPMRTAYFSSARRPGVVLRVSTMARAGTRDRRHTVRGERRDAGEPAQEIQSGALGGQQRARSAGERVRDLTRRDTSPILDQHPKCWAGDRAA